MQISKREVENQANDYNDNYVATHVIGKGERSPLFFDEDRVFYDNNSCGPELLAPIDGQSFQGVEASNTGCGFYL